MLQILAFDKDSFPYPVATDFSSINALFSDGTVSISAPIASTTPNTPTKPTTSTTPTKKKTQFKVLVPKTKKSSKKPKKDSDVKETTLLSKPNDTVTTSPLNPVLVDLYLIYFFFLFIFFYKL